MDLAQIKQCRGWTSLLQFHLSTCFSFETIEEFEEKVMTTITGDKENEIVEDEKEVEAQLRLLRRIRAQLDVEGVWRKSGNLQRVRRLALQMKLNFLAGSGMSGVSNVANVKADEEKGTLTDLATIQEEGEAGEYSVHDLCHFVKKHLFPMLREQHSHFLRFLSLLARQLFISSQISEETFIGSPIEQKAAKAMRLYTLLAEGGRGPSRLFSSLLSLLSATIQRGSENRMTSSSLATIFLPLFFPGAEMEGSAATTYGDSGKLALLTWLLSEYHDIVGDPVPRDLYADLLQLQARGSHSDQNSCEKKRKVDEDEEVYTSMRFCARKKQASSSTSTPQVQASDEVEDVTARELAALYAHVQASADQRLIDKFAKHNRLQQNITPKKTPSVSSNRTPLRSLLKSAVHSLTKKKQQRLDFV